MRLFNSPRKLWGVLATVVLGTTLATVTLTTETASASEYACKKLGNVLCMWETTNYGAGGGATFQVYINQHAYNTCVTPTKGKPYKLWMKKSASSLLLWTSGKNYMTIGGRNYYVTVKVYDNEKCTGDAWKFASNGTKQAPNLYNYIWRPSGVRLDNKISSYKIGLETVP